MPAGPPLIVDDQVFQSFHEYRSALAAFLKRPDAVAELQDNERMRAALLHAYHHHYHWDPASGAPPGPDEIVTVVVTRHAKWDSACYAVVVKDRAEPVTFAWKKLKADRVSSEEADGANAAPSSSPGQRRRNMNEALRLAVEPLLDRWVESHPLPSECPITGLQLSPLWVLKDATRRIEPSAPTIDHFAPSFQARVHAFLAAEGQTVDSLDVRKDAAAGVWEMADAALKCRWVHSHGTEGLRWVSLKANGLLNREQQQKDG